MDDTELESECISNTCQRRRQDRFRGKNSERGNAEIEKAIKLVLRKKQEKKALAERVQNSIRKRRPSKNKSAEESRRIARNWGQKINWFVLENGKYIRHDAEEKTDNNPRIKLTNNQARSWNDYVKKINKKENKQKEKLGKDRFFQSAQANDVSNSSDSEMSDSSSRLSFAYHSDSD